MIALASQPRAGEWELSAAWFARRAAATARSRVHYAPPSLLRQLAWQVRPSDFAHDALGVDLDPWQTALLHGAHRRCLVNANRQAGKTFCASIVVAHRALFRPGSTILAVAPSQRQSKLLIRAVRSELRASRIAGTLAVDNVHELELANESRVIGLPANEDTIRGYPKPDLIVVDEASRVSDGIFTALTPMQATNFETASFWAISTPWGRRGWWWNEWETGGADWHRVRMPATECPRITPAFLARERRSMGDLRFRAEYLCEFTETEGTVFPQERIRAAMQTDVAPLFSPVGPAPLVVPTHPGVAPLFPAGARGVA